MHALHIGTPHTPKVKITSKSSKSYNVRKGTTRVGSGEAGGGGGRLEEEGKGWGEVLSKDRKGKAVMEPVTLYKQHGSNSPSPNSAVPKHASPIQNEDEE